MQRTYARTYIRTYIRTCVRKYVAACTFTILGPKVENEHANWLSSLSKLRVSTWRVMEGWCHHGIEFLCSRHDISCVPRKAFDVFEARHFLCSTHSNSCVPRNRIHVFQARHVPCSMQNISCAPRPKIPVFHA